MPMRTISPARSPTGTRATFAAARTSRSCWAKPELGSAGRTAGAISACSIPGEGDLVEQLVAELFRRAGDRAAAERPIELDRGLVVGQRPHHQALHAALHEVAPRSGEQPPAEAEPLE